jgi:Protein phosphatase 2C
MSDYRWTWAAARSTGTSHIKAGKQCDDYGACLELSDALRTTLIAVAADGAGSASHSFRGSRIVTASFVRSAVRYLHGGQSPADLTHDLVDEWIDDVRDRIAAVANRLSAIPRDFASTLIAALIGTEASAIVHVGDGACVYRNGSDTAWKVATWPAQGEYAATTFFVTDEPQPSVQVVTISEPVSEVAVFSDGIERLALDFATKTAYAPFFDKMFAPLNATAPGRDRRISRALQEFLDGPSVCARTDDDKTVILARRIVE